MAAQTRLVGQTLTPKLVDRVQPRRMVHRPVTPREPNRPMSTSRHHRSQQRVPGRLVLKQVGGRTGLRRELQVVMSLWPPTLPPTRARPGIRDTQATFSTTLSLRPPRRERMAQRNEPGVSMLALVERRHFSPVLGLDVTVLVVPLGQTHPARRHHHRKQADIGASVLLI